MTAKDKKEYLIFISKVFNADSDYVESLYQGLNDSWFKDFKSKQRKEKIKQLNDKFR